VLLVALLLPIAVYLLILAQINRRPRALMVSGPWDFAGVVFAAAGFLLFGGPAILSSLSLNETWRRFWLLGRDSSGLTNDDLLYTLRLALFGLYFAGVVTAVSLLLWRRRRVTAIYNVDAAVIEGVLGETFERWRLPYVQTGNVLTFEPEASDDVGDKARGANLVDRTTTLEVEVAAGMNHATLRWDPPDSRLRREVETQLARALAQTPAPDGNVGDWLLLVSGVLFFLLLVGLTVLTVVWVLR
jgi:hypothetical protein